MNAWQIAYDRQQSREYYYPAELYEDNVQMKKVDFDCMVEHFEEVLAMVFGVEKLDTQKMDFHLEEVCAYMGIKIPESQNILGA